MWTSHARLAAAALLLIGGCALAAAADDEPKQPLPPLQQMFPFDQVFSLRDLNGKPVPDGLDISIKIDGAMHGSGFAGCNSYSAVMYPVKDQHLLVGQFALTHKPCNKDTQAIENGFLSSLLGSPRWDLVNGDLVIRGPRGMMRLARSL